MNKSSSTSSSIKVTPTSSQEQIAEQPHENKPAHPVPLSNLTQAAVNAKIGQYGSQKSTRPKNTEDRRNDKNNSPWARVSPSSQAKPEIAKHRNLLIQSPRPEHLDDLVDVESDSGVFEKDSPAELLGTTGRSLEQPNERSHLLESGDSYPIKKSGLKVKLSKLPGLPKFGGLNKPRIPSRIKTKSEKGRPRKPGTFEETMGPLSPRTNVLPKTNEEHFSAELLANALESSKVATQVTTENVVQVIKDTENSTKISPSMRATNLIYCIAKGRDLINRPDCPETGAFAQSLRNLPDEERLPLVKTVLRQIPRYYISQMLMNRFDGVKDLNVIKRVCAHQLSDDYPEGDDSLTSTASD
jgi:hypothetical protein